MKKNHFLTLLLCFIVLSPALQAQRRVYDVKEAKFSKADFEKLKSVLKGADPSTYSVQYLMNGKMVEKLGSASFDRLSRLPCTRQFQRHHFSCKLTCHAP